MAFVLSTSARLAIPGLAMVAGTMARQLGGRGIRVNGLLPGRIVTERTRYVGAGAVGTAAIPLRRSGDPNEFGRVAAFVLSPAASYLSGAMIPVNGGASA